MATLMAALTIVLLGLQHTVMAGYMLMFVFYLNMLIFLYSTGQHAVFVVSLLSVSLIVLVMVLLVRLHTSSVQLSLTRMP
jgi:lysylphosphatidylglycerol synthetase-like protein (DUF2156 family)